MLMVANACTEVLNSPGWCLIVYRVHFAKFIVIQNACTLLTSCHGLWASCSSTGPEGISLFILDSILVQ